MKFLWETGWIIAAWFITLINYSGFGEKIHSEDYTFAFFALCSIIILTINKGKLVKDISERYPFYVIGIIFFFIIIPVILGSGHGITYLSSFLVILFYSHFSPSNKTIFISGMIIAGFGLALMYEYKYGSLNGWNDNGIAMTGLFSYLFFAISLYGNNKFINKAIGIIFTILYIQAFELTDSRGSSLALILAIITIFQRPLVLNLLKKNSSLSFIYFSPLIIALITCWIATTDYFTQLDLWSIAEYDKPIFNGREKLWNRGLERLYDSYLFGIGKFDDNYHNSAITCLAAFGLFGYLSWVKCFISFTKYLRHYLQDSYIYGALCAFIIIYLQQSIELGFISECPNLLPYMILGLAIGRTKIFFKKKQA